MQRFTGKTIDEYIRMFPARTREVLSEVRKTIRAAAPEAQETINYAIPTFTLNGNLVHFAAFDKHIGFYPTPGGIAAFQKELAGYPSAKGSVQFPLDKPMPLKLITRIVKFRVAQQMKKGAAGQRTKK